MAGSLQEIPREAHNHAAINRRQREREREREKEKERESVCVCVRVCLWGSNTLQGKEQVAMGADGYVYVIKETRQSKMITRIVHL